MRNSDERIAVEEDELTEKQIARRQMVQDNFTAFVKNNRIKTCIMVANAVIDTTADETMIARMAVIGISSDEEAFEMVKSLEKIRSELLKRLARSGVYDGTAE